MKKKVKKKKRKIERLNFENLWFARRKKKLLFHFGLKLGKDFETEFNWSTLNFTTFIFTWRKLEKWLLRQTHGLTTSICLFISCPLNLSQGRNFYVPSDIFKSIQLQRWVVFQQFRVKMFELQFFFKLQTCCFLKAENMQAVIMQSLILSSQKIASKNSNFLRFRLFQCFSF